MSKQKEFSREDIKAQALRMISEKGFGNFSMRALAKDCDAGIGTIYLYFKDKAELLFELASDFWKNCFDGISSIEKGADFYSNLRADYEYIAKYLSTFESGFLKGFALLGLSGRTHGTGQMDEYLERIHCQILALIARYRGAICGILVDVGDDYIADFIFNNFRQMLMEKRGDYDKFEIVIKKLLQ